MIERLAQEMADAEATLSEATEANVSASDAAADAPDRITRTREARETHEEQETEARAAVSARKASRNALTSEIESLETSLAAENSTDMGAAIVTRMRAAPGYEAAPRSGPRRRKRQPPNYMVFSEKARGWLALKLLGASPSVGEPLSAYVEAPEALARRLAVTAVVSRAEGPEAQKTLKPGQHLVSPEGDLWRWDGYFSGAETRAGDPATIRLARLNRLDALRAELESDESSLANAVQALDRFERELADARLTESNARAEHQKVQDTAASAARAFADAEARLQRLRASHTQISGEVERQRHAQTRAEESLTSATASLVEIGDPVVLRTEADSARAALVALRLAHTEAKSEHDELTAAERARSGRLESITRDLNNWQDRAEKAKTRRSDLQARQETIRLERDRGGICPGEVAALRDALVADLTAAEKRVTEANDRLSSAEAALRQATRDDSEAASALATAREAPRPRRGRQRSC